MSAIVNVMDESNFKCVKCDEAARNGHCGMFHTGLRRKGPALVCKECRVVPI